MKTNKIRPKILIVEDDEVSTMYMTVLLEPVGCSIIVSKTGASAVEQCRQHPDIDIVLMDIKMPGMSGYEATRQIRKFNESVYIIAQTAYALKEDKDKALMAGCNDFISKPVNGEYLLKRITDVLSERNPH
jgi:CheY-like chemotaxis protein